MVYAQYRIRLENEMHKHLWDFENQMDHQIPTRLQDIVRIKKKITCRIEDIAGLVDHWVNIKENEKTDKNVDVAKELKRIVQHEGNGDTSCNWCARNDLQMFGKRAGRIGTRKTSGDHIALLRSGRMLRSLPEMR